MGGEQIGEAGSAAVEARFDDRRLLVQRRFERTGAADDLVREFAAAQDDLLGDAAALVLDHAARLEAAMLHRLDQLGAGGAHGFVDLDGAAADRLHDRAAVLREGGVDDRGGLVEFRLERKAGLAEGDRRIFEAGGHVAGRFGRHILEARGGGLRGFAERARGLGGGLDELRSRGFADIAQSLRGMLGRAGERFDHIAAGRTESFG